MRHTTIALLGLTLLGGAFIGCGSDSSSGGGTVQDYVAQCKRICDKLESCGGDLATAADACRNACDEFGSDTSGSGGGSSSDAPTCSFSELKSKVDECTKGACDDVLTCLDEAAALCDAGSSGGDGGGSGSGGSTSTGGGSSTGGDTGAGGSSGSGDCSSCEAAVACCEAFYKEYPDQGDPADCASFPTACAQLSGDAQSQFIQGACESILSSGQSLGLAGCQ